MNTSIERQTAYKLWLSDLHNRSMIKQEGEFMPSYIEVRNKKINRINVIATIVQKNQKEDSTFASITLDDGSAQIRAKVWQDTIQFLQSVYQGDCVLVIGKLREYNDELYITPEIVRKQDPNWLYIRQHELLKEYGKPSSIDSTYQFPQQSFQQEPTAQSFVQEEMIQNTSESNRQKLFNVITRLDSEEGASITEVITQSGLQEQEAEQLLTTLLQEGEIFKMSNDKIKIT